MKKILDWLDERTGWRKIKEVILDRHIPKGVDWRYTLGSVTLFLFPPPSGHRHSSGHALLPLSRACL